MKDIKSKLKTKLKKGDTSERCGIVLTNGEIIEAPNTHSDPEKGFVIPPEVMFEAIDNLYGTWHTHPAQVSNLSQEDYFGFLAWPELHHFVVGVDGVREFTVDGEIIVEV